MERFYTLAYVNQASGDYEKDDGVVHPNRMIGIRCSLEEMQEIKKRLPIGNRAKYLYLISHLPVIRQKDGEE